MEEKRHYKLYKSGKNWVVASIAAITVLSGSGLASTALNVHAATPVAAAQSNINFAGLKSQLNWSNQKVAGASIYTSANGMKLVAQLKKDVAIANGYIANPKSTTQAKVTAITTALRNDGIALNNEVANILNGQLFWSNKKQASDYVTAQGKALFAQFQTALATAKSYVANPSMATPANVVAISAKLHQLGLDLYASKVTDLKAQLVWSNQKAANEAAYTTDAGKKAFAQLQADIKTANGYVAQPEFATPAEIAAIVDALHNDGLALNASVAAGDATQLNKDITAAAALVATDYTKDSFATLTTALDAAKKVAADKTANQAAIDAADKALTAAKTALVNSLNITALTADLASLSTTNFTGKDDAGNDATSKFSNTPLTTVLASNNIATKATGQLYFTASSYATLLQAYNAANAALKNSASKQADIDTADSNLKSAINGLIAKSSGADTVQLKADVVKADAIVLANTTTPVYDSVTMAKLVAVLGTASSPADGTAHSVLAKESATQLEVNAADIALQAALNGLNKLANPSGTDKSKLAVDLATYKATSNTSATGSAVYTKAAWQVFVNAYNNLVAVNNDAKALQYEATIASSTPSNANDANGKYAAEFTANPATATLANGYTNVDSNKTIEGADAWFQAAKANLDKPTSKATANAADDSLLQQSINGNTASSISNFPIAATGYTAASYAKYQADYKAAVVAALALYKSSTVSSGLIDNTTTTGQAAIDKAVAAFTTAKADLVPVVAGAVDKSTLQADIASALAISNAGNASHTYFATAWTDFQSALANAQKVNANANATAGTVLGSGSSNAVTSADFGTVSGDATKYATVSGADVALQSMLLNLKNAKTASAIDDSALTSVYVKALGDANVTKANAGTVIAYAGIASLSTTPADGTYTKASWQAFVQALQSAAALYSTNSGLTAGTGYAASTSTPNAGVTQGQVDNAYTALNNAYNNLTGDTSNLTAELSKATALTNTNADGSHVYTTSTWSVLQNTIAATQTFLKSSQLTGTSTDSAAILNGTTFSATPSINAVLAALKSAENGLAKLTATSGVQDIADGSVTVAGDAKQYNGASGLVSVAQAVVNTNNADGDNYKYTAASYAAVKSALTTATALLTDGSTFTGAAAGAAGSLVSGTTQAQFDKAFNGLLSALSGLTAVNGLDKAAANAALQRASQLSASAYTAHSLAAVTAAVNTVNGDLTATTAPTQKALDIDVTKLTKAIDALVTINKATLEGDYYYALTLQSSVTPANSAAFQSALTIANGVLHASLASADQIASADQSLKAAIASVSGN